MVDTGVMVQIHGGAGVGSERLIIRVIPHSASGMQCDLARLESARDINPKLTCGFENGSVFWLRKV